MHVIKVSVVMAVYNAGQYLEEALESLLNQSLQEIEIICVNDESTDGSLKILREYEKRDQRIKVVNIKHEGKGAAHARNVGLSMAGGEYLSILDSDDFFEPDMLEKIYLKAKEEDADVVIFNAYKYDNEAKVDRAVSTILATSYLPDKDSFNPEDYADQIFFITGGMAWNSLFRRNMVVDNNLAFYGVNHADDLVFTYLSYVCAKKITLLNQRLMHYRYNTETSQTYRKTQWPESGYLATYYLKQKLIEKGLYEKYKKCFIKRALSYAFYYLDSMNTLESYHKLFYDLKNKYLEKLGAYEIADEEYEEEFWIVKRDIIKNGTPEEYLFYPKHNTLFAVPYNDMLKGATYFEIVPSGKRIVLYGAGNMGRCVFANSIFDRSRTILAWVDQDYDQIGYPVQNPKMIFDMQFDICFVAIENFATFELVKKYLVNHGVPEDKVWWLMRGREDQYFKSHSN